MSGTYVFLNHSGDDFVSDLTPREMPDSAMCMLVRCKTDRTEIYGRSQSGNWLVLTKPRGPCPARPDCAHMMTSCTRTRSRPRQRLALGDETVPAMLRPLLSTGSLSRCCQLVTSGPVWFEAFALKVDGERRRAEIVGIGGGGRKDASRYLGRSLMMRMLNWRCQLFPRRHTVGAVENMPAYPSRPILPTKTGKQVRPALITAGS